jgi:uncharacterized membrane protein YkvA (DUF1232 family)
LKFLSLINLRQKAKLIKRDVMTIYYAMKDPRTPWYAKAFAALVVGYALSPIDLIPDFIPILGYLDDIILVPLGILITIRLIPPAVIDDCRKKVDRELDSKKPRNWFAAIIIILIWLALCIWVGSIIYHWLSHN